MLERAKTALVVIDFQEKLLPTIHQGEAALEKALRLIRFARELGLPVLWTEQYPKGLGPTVAAAADALAGLTPQAKTSFGCVGDAGFRDALAATGATQVLITGIEAHVCVLQTALGLRELGLEVFVARDAVSSSAPEECAAGLERMASNGVQLVTVQMAMFELLREAGTPEFKRVLPLLK